MREALKNFLRSLIVMLDGGGRQIDDEVEFGRLVDRHMLGPRGSHPIRERVTNTHRPAERTSRIHSGHRRVRSKK